MKISLTKLLQQQKQKDKSRGAIIIPVIGARTEAQIKDNLGCLDFQLTKDCRQSIRIKKNPPLLMIIQCKGIRQHKEKISRTC